MTTRRNPAIRRNFSKKNLSTVTIVTLSLVTVHVHNGNGHDHEHYGDRGRSCFVDSLRQSSFSPSPTSEIRRTEKSFAAKRFVCATGHHDKQAPPSNRSRAWWLASTRDLIGWTGEFFITLFCERGVSWKASNLKESYGTATLIFAVLV